MKKFLLPVGKNFNLGNKKIAAKRAGLVNPHPVLHLEFITKTQSFEFILKINSCNIACKAA